MSATETRMMSWAQITLSFFFILAVFYLLWVYETGRSHLSAEGEKFFITNAEWLKSAVMLILFFWFQRARQGGLPDASQVITQEHTTPDGTKVKTTSPVGTPLPPVSIPPAPGPAQTLVQGDS